MIIGLPQVSSENSYVAEDNLKYPAVEGLYYGHSHSGVSFAPWRT
jgi:hypothetical protein